MSEFSYEIDRSYPTDFGITPSQTVGPYLHIGLTWQDGAAVVPEGTSGAITIRGTVYDGNHEPIGDAMIETWQADAAGAFAHPDVPAPAVRLQPDGFRGFGRSDTRKDGQFEIRTIKPGRVDDEQAPHIDVSVFARGMINRCVTRIYFADEESANAVDPLLSQVPEDRRRTLIAAEKGDHLRFDIHLQGDEETVFFEL